MNSFIKYNKYLLLSCFVAAIITYLINKNHVNFFSLGIYFFEIIISNLILIVAYFILKIFNVKNYEIKLRHITYALCFSIIFISILNEIIYERKKNRQTYIGFDNTISLVSDNNISYESSTKFPL
jgi:hypothetical protein